MFKKSILVLDKYVSRSHFADVLLRKFDQNEKLYRYVNFLNDRVTLVITCVFTVCCLFHMYNHFTFKSTISIIVFEEKGYFLNRVKSVKQFSEGEAFLMNCKNINIFDTLHKLFDCKNQSQTAKVSNLVGLTSQISNSNYKITS